MKKFLSTMVVPQRDTFFSKLQSFLFIQTSLLFNFRPSPENLLLDSMYWQEEGEREDISWNLTVQVQYIDLQANTQMTGKGNRKNEGNRTKNFLSQRNKIDLLKNIRWLEALLVNAL